MSQSRQSSYARRKKVLKYSSFESIAIDSADVEYSNFRIEQVSTSPVLGTMMCYWHAIVSVPYSQEGSTLTIDESLTQQREALV